MVLAGNGVKSADNVSLSKKGWRTSQLKIVGVGNGANHLRFSGPDFYRHGRICGPSGSGADKR